MPQRLSMQGIQYLAESIRPFMHSQIKTYPLSAYLRLVWNDALTYDPATKKGGLKYNLKNSQVARSPQNRGLQLLALELQ